jgi:hypothetical protein
MPRRKRTTLILLSVLFHIIILLFWEGAAKLGILAIVPPPPQNANPIVFELEKPKEQPRQVVETPDDAKSKPPEKADLLSDKDSRARNPETAPKLKEGDAYSRGLIDSYELPTPRIPAGETMKKPDKEKPAVKDEKDQVPSDMEPAKTVKVDDLDKFYQQYRERKEKAKKYGTTEKPPSVFHDQQLMQTLNRGGLSFNTYNWNFAPYMLALKKRIQQNMYLPKAFSELGVISGETVLKFRIYPGGRMEALEILGYRGHISLMQTSKFAVELSAPFPPLPSDFPEPFLEITGKFRYIGRK